MLKILQKIKSNNKVCAVLARPMMLSNHNTSIATIFLTIYASHVLQNVCTVVGCVRVCVCVLQIILLNQLVDSLNILHAQKFTVQQQQQQTPETLLKKLFIRKECVASYYKFDNNDKN